MSQINKNNDELVSNISSSETTTTSSSLATAKHKNKSCIDYSYIVLIAAFIAYMLGSLLSTCFGVLFESLANDLKWSNSKVAFIGACLSSLDNLLAPFASALINLYGCRKTSILGGLLASLGIIGSAYVENFWLFGLLMGGLSGFGTSLVLVSTVVVVTYYFEEKPSFASGLVISGASFGQSIFSLIIIKLTELYGRSGCLLILGGLLLNICVCGALFKPLDWEKEDELKEEDEEQSTCYAEEVELYEDEETFESQKNKIDSTSNKKETDLFLDNHQKHQIPEDFVNHHVYPLTFKNYYYRSLINLNTRLFLTTKNVNNLSVLSSSSLTLNDIKQNIDHKLSLSCPNLSSDQFKISNNSNENDSYSTNTHKNDLKILYSIKKILIKLKKSIIETLKLFKIVPFSIFAICNFILSSFYEAPFYFINSYMTENGFTQREAGFVTVIIGVVSIFAAIAYGYIGDIERINWIILYSSSLFLTGLFNFLLPFFIENFTMTTISMVLMGVFISVNDVLVPIVCVNLVGYDDFVSAYGLIFCCQGLASLVGPPCLGKSYCKHFQIEIF